jgi:putative membrane protein
MMGGMMGGSGFGGFGTFGLIGGILNLVITVGVIIGVVALVIWVVRRLGQESGVAAATSGKPFGTASPREIVQLRYAQGEITREQYQEILADLN